MRAALLTALNAPLTVTDVGVIPPEFGQVSVRVLSSGICGAQLAEIAGHKGNAKFIPHLLGHEGVGIVEHIGVGVTRVLPGNKVVLHWRKADGIESDFPQYIYGSKLIKSGKVVTFAEQVVVSENRVTAVPHATPNDICALLGCGLSTALGTIERDAGVMFGESVMVIGVGGLGMNLIAAAKLAHACPIVAVDVKEEKSKLALEMGATLFITPRELSGQSIWDVIIDTAGNADTMAKALRCLGPSGRYIMVGQPKPGMAVAIEEANHMFEGDGKMIKATQGGGFMPHIDIPRYVRMHTAGKLNLDGIITQRIRLEDINDGIDLVRNGLASRVMIEMA